MASNYDRLINANQGNAFIGTMYNLRNALFAKHNNLASHAYTVNNGYYVRNSKAYIDNSSYYPEYGDMNEQSTTQYIDGMYNLPDGFYTNGFITVSQPRDTFIVDSDDGFLSASKLLFTGDYSYRTHISNLNVATLPLIEFAEGANINGPLFYNDQLDYLDINIPYNCFCNNLFGSSNCINANICIADNARVTFGMRCNNTNVYLGNGCTFSIGGTSIDAISNINIFSGDNCTVYSPTYYSSYDTRYAFQLYIHEALGNGCNIRLQRSFYSNVKQFNVVAGNSCILNDPWYEGGASGIVAGNANVVVGDNCNAYNLFYSTWVANNLRLTFGNDCYLTNLSNHYVNYCNVEINIGYNCNIKNMFYATQSVAYFNIYMPTGAYDSSDYSSWPQEIKNNIRWY